MSVYVMFLGVTYVTWFKGAWACAVLLCAGMNYRTLRDTYVDLREVLKDNDPAHDADRIHASRALRMQFVIFFFQCLLFFVRFWSQFWPDPGNAEFARRWVWDGTLITLGQLMLGYNAILDARDRRRTIAALPPMPPAPVLPSPREIVTAFPLAQNSEGD